MNRMIGVSTKLEGLTREKFAEYRKNGIGAVEVSVAEFHFDELDLATVAKEMRAEGLDTWSFHLRFFPFKIYNIARLNSDERRFAVEYQREWIKRAGDEGFRYAIIHPSGEPISDEKRPEAMKAACESLDLLAEDAKRAGIVLAVENLPRTCLAKNSAEMLQLLDANPYLRSCFDTNHLLQEDPLAYIEAVKEKIVTLHVSDYDFINERHWLPLEGKIDWAELMKGFDDIGYNGVFMYEVPRTAANITREVPLTPADYVNNHNKLIEIKQSI